MRSLLKYPSLLVQLHCQLPSCRRNSYALYICYINISLFYSFLYSHLTYALLVWGRSGRYYNAAQIGCAYLRALKLLTDYDQKFLNLWLFCCIKGFRHKYPQFSSIFQWQIIIIYSSTIICTTPETEQIVISILNLLISQKLKKCYFYQVIPIWNNLPSSLNNELQCLHSKTN